MAKLLYRSNQDRMIAGVCGGIAQYYAIDPLFVRAVFLIASLIHALGLAVYAVVWLLVPEQGKVSIAHSALNQIQKEPLPHVDIPWDSRSQRMAGIILLILGALLLLNNFWPDAHIQALWPLLLVIFGISMLLTPRR